MGHSANSVAIVALIVTGTVGVLAPLITGGIQWVLQARSLGHAKRLDALAQQRRVIFDSLEQLAHAEHYLTDELYVENVPDSMILGFVTHRERLKAMFGVNSDVSKAYERAFDAITPVAVLVATKDAPQRKAKLEAARREARTTREDLLTAVRPYLVDKALI